MGQSATSIEDGTPQRPSHFMSDLEWAQWAQGRVWELEDELAAATDCLESNERNIKAWREEAPHA